MEATEVIGPVQARGQEPVPDQMYTIKALRKARGWSQLQLAIRLDVVPTTVSSWERLFIRPSAYNLEQMEEVFGVPTGRILVKSPGRTHPSPNYGLALFNEQ